jgi:hypothetical protein
VDDPFNRKMTLLRRQQLDQQFEQRFISIAIAPAPTTSQDLRRVANLRPLNTLPEMLAAYTKGSAG